MSFGRILRLNNYLFLERYRPGPAVEHVGDVESDLVGMASKLAKKVR